MENYKLSVEDMKEIDNLLNEFIKNYEPHAKNTCELLNLNFKPFNKQTFITEYITAHDIIVKDDKISKYFILGNFNKFKKVSDVTIPLLEIIENTPVLFDDYVDLLRNMSILVENANKEPDQRFLTTVAIYIEKTQEEKREKMLEESCNELKIREKEESRRIYKEKKNKMQIPSIDTLLEKLEKNPEAKNFKIGDLNVGDMVKEIMKDTTSDDINNTIQKAVEENDGLANIIGTLTSTINGEGNPGDIGNVLEKFMPGLNINNSTSLTDEIIKDLLEIFDNDNSEEKVKEILTKKTQKYVKMFNEKTINVIGLLSCLLNIVSNKEKSDMLKSVDLSRLDMKHIVDLVFQIIPNGDTFKEFFSMGDVGDASDLGSFITGLISTNKNILPSGASAKDVKLDNEKLNELDDLVNNFKG